MKYVLVSPWEQLNLTSIVTIKYSISKTKMIPPQPTYDKETNSQDCETTTKEPQGEKENKIFPTEVICGAS